MSESKLQYYTEEGFQPQHLRVSGNGRLIDRWRDATVAIGQTQQAEIRYANGRVVHKKLFIVVGTGVIFGLQNDPSEPPCLVTAKHVFRDNHNHCSILPPTPLFLVR
ncbi:MAG: hypothetical protein R3B83_05945 [Nitrospirales bacterium]|nr:hypothetical protein [Nitrospirales bacterium]